MAVDIVVWFCLIIVLLITAYPFWYVVVASFSDGYDFMRGGVYLWPRIFTLDNYKNLLGQKIWTNAFVVSFYPYHRWDFSDSMYDLPGKLYSVA